MVETIPYLKMNGLGNDFIVVDARASGVRFSSAQVQCLSDRASGVGCDQFIVIEPAPYAGADVFMRIYNEDGGEVDACGNASRCVAALVAKELARDDVVIATNVGVLPSSVAGDQVTVDMGVPRFGWEQIPLAEEFADTRGIELQIGPIDAPVLHTPSVVNVGNPHAVFWVTDDPDGYDLHRFGPLLENHPIFPERANISLAQVLGPDRIKVRVWERGVGLTRACGTAACAVAVCAARAKRSDRKVTIELPGGPLALEWREHDDHILMTGPWALDGQGEITAEMLGDDVAEPAQ